MVGFLLQELALQIVAVDFQFGLGGTGVRGDASIGWRGRRGRAVNFYWSWDGVDVGAFFQVNRRREQRVMAWEKTTVMTFMLDVFFGMLPRSCKTLALLLPGIS